MSTKQSVETMTIETNQTNHDKPLRYVDTGKVKIGIYYVAKPSAPTFSDMEFLQRRLLPKPLGSLYSWPSLRELVRWWIT